MGTNTFSLRRGWTCHVSVKAVRLLYSAVWCRGDVHGRLSWRWGLTQNTLPADWTHGLQKKIPSPSPQLLCRAVCVYVFWAPKLVMRRIFHHRGKHCQVQYEHFHCSARGHLEKIRDKRWHWEAELTFLFLCAEFFPLFSLKVSSDGTLHLFPLFH